MTILFNVDCWIHSFDLLSEHFYSFWTLFCVVLYQVGYLSASIRTVADARVGDTITHYDRKADNSLPGYEEATPMVFCGLFPVDADQYWYLICTLFFVEQNNCILISKLNVSGVNCFPFFVLLADFLTYEMHLRSFNSMMLHWRWAYIDMLEKIVSLFLDFRGP